MQVNEYQKLAVRTANIVNIVNAALGLCGEAGEVADLVKKWQYQGHNLDKKKVIEELGDVCWYVAVASEALGIDLEEVMRRNVEKLKARYPSGFDVNNSINREV